MLGFLFGLLAGMLTLAAAFAGFIIGLLTAEAAPREEEFDEAAEEDPDGHLFPEHP